MRKGSTVTSCPWSGKQVGLMTRWKPLGLRYRIPLVARLRPGIGKSLIRIAGAARRILNPRGEELQLQRGSFALPQPCPKKSSGKSAHSSSVHSVAASVSGSPKLLHVPVSIAEGDALFCSSWRRMQGTASGVSFGVHMVASAVRSCSERRVDGAPDSS